MSKANTLASAVFFALFPLSWAIKKAGAFCALSGFALCRLLPGAHVQDLAMINDAGEAGTGNASSRFCALSAFAPSAFARSSRARFGYDERRG